MVKIGRNAPCPCGSGEKYKKCCLSVQPTDIIVNDVFSQFRLCIYCHIYRLKPSSLGGTAFFALLNYGTKKNLRRGNGISQRFTYDLQPLVPFGLGYQIPLSCFDWRSEVANARDYPSDLHAP